MGQVQFREQFADRLGEIERALARPWYSPSLPGALDRDFEQSTNSPQSRQIRFWFWACLGIQCFSLLRDWHGGMLWEGLALRLGVGVSLLACAIWVLRKPVAVATREALTTLVVLANLAVILLLAILAEQPYTDRYLLAGMLAFVLTQVILPFTFRQIVVNCVVSAILLAGSIALAYGFGSNVRPDLLLPPILFMGTAGALYQLHTRRVQFLLELRSRYQTEALEQANRTMTQLLHEDALTGVFNRRSFDERIHATWETASARGQSIALTIVDVDHFKAFNDLYGHQAGDACLRQVAKALKDAVGPHGDLCRYGGEEFVAMLPGMAEETASLLAHAMRAAVESLDLAHLGAPRKRVTVSIGVAIAAPQSDVDLRTLIYTADAALYASKRAGRNCVTASAAPAGRVPLKAAS